MELPAPATGTITEILAEEGETVTVGQVIARMQARRRRRPRRLNRDDATRIRCANGGARQSWTVALNASPVARRIAAQQGVDLAAPQRHRPRRPDHQGRRARRRQRRQRRHRTAPPAPAAPAPAKPAGAQLIKGGAAALARYMDESRSIPTATSFRTLTVTALEQRRAQLKDAGHRVSFTHLIAYAIARVATDEMPVMAHHFAEIDGKPHRIDDGACNLGLAVDVEKKDGTRTLMVPVIRDAGRKSFNEFLDAYNALVEKARTNTLTADDLTGANVSLTNPGGIGTIASVPRLMVGQGTIVATGSIAYPVGLGAIGAVDRRREGHDDDLDLRPPDHPGRRVGPLPAADRGATSRARRASTSACSPISGVALPAAARRRPPPRAADAAGRRPLDPRPCGPAPCPTRSSCRRSRPRPRCSRPTAPTGTWPPSSTRSAASPRATRRSIPSRSA